MTTVGPHDGITVIHTPSGHLRSLGCWVECECGWIGPSRPTEAAAEEAHAAHVKAKTTRTTDRKAATA